MKGTSPSVSNHAGTASRRIDGANGRERSAPLDLEIEDVLHVGAPRIAQDRAVAERARSPFQAALEPADHLALGDRLRRAPAQGRLVGDALDGAARGVEIGAALGQRPRSDRASPMDPSRRGP